MLGILVYARLNKNRSTLAWSKNPHVTCRISIIDLK